MRALGLQKSPNMSEAQVASAAPADGTADSQQVAREEPSSATVPADAPNVAPEHAAAHKAYHEAHNLRLAMALETEGGELPVSAKPSRVTWRDLAGASFNMLNYVLGAGILGLPYAFSRAGWVLAVVALGGVACAGMASMRLLLWSSRLSGGQSYEQLALRSYGSKAATFVKWFIILDSFGPLSAYQTIIGQAFRNFIVSHWEIDSSFFDERVITFLILIVILGPLSFIQNIGSLAWTSLLSVLPLVYLLTLEVVMLAKHGREPDAGKMQHFASDFFLALPIIVFAFSSQQTLFPIKRELNEQGGTDVQLRTIIKSSFSAVFIVYVWAGMIAYLQFGKTAQPNILNNYGTGVAADILQLTTAFSLVLSFPIIVFPSRYNLDRLLFPDTLLTYRRFVLENLGIIITAYALTVAIPSLATLLGIFGAVTSTAIGYVLPPLFYLGLGGPERTVAVPAPQLSQSQSQSPRQAPGTGASEAAVPTTAPAVRASSTPTPPPRDPKWGKRRLGAWAMLILGGAAGIASFVIVVVDWARRV